MVRECALWDWNLFQLTKTCFVTHNTAQSSWVSRYSWEERGFCRCWENALWVLTEWGVWRCCLELLPPVWFSVCLSCLPSRQKYRNSCLFVNYQSGSACRCTGFVSWVCKPRIGCMDVYGLWLVCPFTLKPPSSGVSIAFLWLVLACHYFPLFCF